MNALNKLQNLNFPVFGSHSLYLIIFKVLWDVLSVLVIPGYLNAIISVFTSNASK